MERMFLITASNRLRVESRILQVLDHHAVPVESFSSLRLGEEARVTFMAKLEEDAARRTCDMLRRLQDVHSIDCFALSGRLLPHPRHVPHFVRSGIAPAAAAGHLINGRAGRCGPSGLGRVSDHRQCAGYRRTSRQPASLRRGRSHLRGFDRRAKPPQSNRAAAARTTGIQCT